ncbi:hypothetical protein EON82_25435 [bacterium]|nr:MAG: hypothetical protein EON82_25435 [bacterium]
MGRLKRILDWRLSIFGDDRRSEIANPKSSAPGVLDRPDVGDTKGSGGWIVTVYDNDHNTMDEVLVILIVATQCPVQEAEIETWEVHNLGRSVVHHGGQAECERVAETIRQIGIRVTVTEE